MFINRALAALTLFGLATVAADASTIFATNSTGALLSFDSSAPGVILSNHAITGLNQGETLVGIDFRPLNQLLYAVSTQGRIFTVNTTNAVATNVATISQTVTGTAFGVDFNPVADRIRLIGNDDQNLRIVPGTGAATVDGTISYAVGDANAGRNPNVVASAYTNSFAGASSTTLYDIDSNLGILTIQNPPNNGTLITVGSLGLAITQNAGFDIEAGTNAGFGAFQPTAGFSNLYSVNLTTGSATSLGSIGSNQVITGLAVAPTPEPGTMLLLASALLGVGAFRRRRT